jgi:hypothetical protein
MKLKTLCALTAALAATMLTIQTANAQTEQFRALYSSKKEIINISGIDIAISAKIEHYHSDTKDTIKVFWGSEDTLIKTYTRYKLPDHEEYRAGDSLIAKQDDELDMFQVYDSLRAYVARGDTSAKRFKFRVDKKTAVIATCIYDVQGSGSNISRYHVKLDKPVTILSKFPYIKFNELTAVFDQSIISGGFLRANILYIVPFKIKGDLIAYKICKEN